MKNSQVERPEDEVIFERDGFRCVYCDFDGRTFDTWCFLQVDHFVPRSRGGTDDQNNLVTSCVICNHMKGAMIFSSIKDARSEIAKWRGQMKEYWAAHVKHRIQPQKA